MTKTPKYSLILFIAILSIVVTNLSATEISPLFNQALPEFPGKEGLMLTVEYSPGEASEQHRHNAHVFVYVLEGAVVMQVDGDEAVVLHAGETFYESPQDIHSVSRNASDTESAKILVFMLKEQDHPATLPAH